MTIPWKTCNLQDRLNELNVPPVTAVKEIIGQWLAGQKTYLVVVDRPDGGTTILLQKKVLDKKGGP